MGRHEDRCEMHWERVRRLQEEPHSGDPRFRIHQDHDRRRAVQEVEVWFCTWIGDKVKVMEKAKMGTDKALVKAVIENISVELQPESLDDVDAGKFETECRKAGGANYGTGKRD